MNKMILLIALFFFNCNRIELYAQKRVQQNANAVYSYIVDSVVYGTSKLKIYHRTKKVNNCSKEHLLQFVSTIVPTQELALIINQFLSSKQQKIRKKYFSNSTINIVDSIPVAKKISIAIDNKNIPIAVESPPYLIFNQPVFFNKNNYCLIAYATESGGETFILKKTNGKWARYKMICVDYY